MPANPTQGHVVVAPDKFKGTLEGAEVAARLAAGIRRVRPGLEVRELPVADGGEGTLAAALAAGFTRIPAKVAGPTGLPVDAAIAVKGEVAVVELAQAAGLARLPGGRTAPLAAGSFGVGQLIGRAVSLGVRRIVLGLGAAPAPTAARAWSRRWASACSTPRASNCRPAVRPCAGCTAWIPARWPTPWPGWRSWWPAMSTTRCSALVVPPPSTARRRARTARTWWCWRKV